MLLALLASSACGDKQATERGGRDEAPAVPVTTTIVRMAPWNDTIAALGTATARESVSVTAKVSETVQRVHFDSGDEVAAGAPLVTLSGQQQQASLVAAQAAAEEADRLLRRQSELAEQQLIARASLDSQRATRDAARARVAEIRANLGDRTIRAPFAGVLGIRRVSPGALVTPGTVIATLDDIGRVFVDFPVPEGQLAHLAAGQRVFGRSDAYSGREFEGTVSTVEARVDPATRAVNVRADFPNPDKVLKPGMLLQVRLQRPERQALQVPEISVVQVGRESFVYRVGAGDAVEQVPIQVGGRDDGRVEVLSGLEAGDRIVVDGTGKLRTGSKVVEAEAAVPAATPAPPRTRERRRNAG
ncbi:efflux RND transporter periplasmic adaptor subunit [Luteimonas vadosa]|uniref:Efflux RND transporter periplasmic adaptor subunit n=1 Tax=Luteimonas vadosa TaxID=1165507 RepID=A0ABP9DU48_9GAMM